MNRSTLYDLVLPGLGWVVGIVLAAMLLTSVAALHDAHVCDRKGGRLLVDGPLHTHTMCDVYPFRSQR